MILSKPIYICLILITVCCLVFAGAWPNAMWGLVPVVVLWVLAIQDSLQGEHSLRRNFPILGRARWLAEFLRPFVRQYFIESETDGAPISRMFRSIVYQRAKADVDTIPYGTKIDVYTDGYEWLGHSLSAHNVEDVNNEPRRVIGGEACKQKYSASVFNISAMSFGALSDAAVIALNKGARAGGFYHNTGEGGLSPAHLQEGGDLVWQIGTGYFGCRTADGKFDAALFEAKASHDSVKMIELKLSQGAKPGHGGILPASKNTPEIALIRTVEVGTDVISPSTHPEFDTPIGLLEFIQKLREGSGYKPVGFKLCVGRRTEFIAICKAMIETGIKPDFITVDGGEGGTGAAPLEYSNSVGMPLREGLAFVDDCLTGFGLRDEITVICAGKIFTGFHLVKNLALGADICNSARGMMLALGCVQSLVCHTNKCPTGIATQDKDLSRGLVVEDKYIRVQRFQAETVHAFTDLVSSAGFRQAAELERKHIFRRVSQEKILRYDEIFPPLKSGELLQQPYPKAYEEVMQEASASSFH